MISAVASIYFPLVSHISQQISPHYHGFHHFFRLNMSFMLALAFIHFFLPVFLARAPLSQKEGGPKNTFPIAGKLIVPPPNAQKNTLKGFVLVEEHRLV